jgi:hypothetical protein
MDERFKMHRLYSTRIATIIGAVMLGIFFNYEYFVSNVLRWDLFIILMTMAVSKVAAMIYYRKAN